MRIAIVHYHLRPGGVMRVIAQTTAALHAHKIETVVLTGDDVPGLGYDGTSGVAPLATALRTAARNALGGRPPDAWIFHNPTLGKNRDLPALIERFARDGEAMLLHIHDLAEDGRPENFANIPDPGRLHLTTPRVHHVFINTRDHRLFISAGLPPERAHLLPNPVEAPTPARPALAPGSDALVFYPVRGIRRKNLGEVCLLAALAPAGTRFAVSRAPRNPAEIPTHDFWRMFATTHQLPVWFDVTDRLPPHPDHPAGFDTWCAAATHWLSTSVAEGFGQTLAEAAALRKPLVARRLDPGFVPTDTRGLYTSLKIPGASNDFATLDETAQAAAIVRVLTSPETAEATRIDGEPARIWLTQRLAARTAAPPDPQLAAHAPDRIARQMIEVLTQLTLQATEDPTFLNQQEIGAKIKQRHALVIRPRPLPRRDFPRAVIFDVYGTLLDAPSGGVRPDPAADPAILKCLEKQKHTRARMPATISHPENIRSPSTELAGLVAREHARARGAARAANEADDGIFPEVDLVALWAELLGRPADEAMARLVAEIEDVWHPATPMPGAAAMLRRLAASGIPCGLLSNAQANVWRQLGDLAPGFASDLCVFSHQTLRAKPSPTLFAEMTARLARRGISTRDTWFVGNDPARDIAPARSAGFHTAMFGPRRADAEITIPHWEDFPPPAMM